MTQLKLDAIWKALPALDELQPVLGFLLQTSNADPSLTWAGSGELRTVGERLVDGGDLASGLERIASEEAQHLAAIYQIVGDAIVALGNGDRTGAGRKFLEAASMEEGRDRSDRAAAYAEAAHGVFAAAGDERLISLSMRRWARAKRALGSLDEASDRYQRAYSQALEASDDRGAAEAAIGAGNVFEEQGRFSEAAGWYQKALDALAESNGDGPEQWQALLNLHIVTRSGGDLDGSLPWLERAQTAAAKLGDESADPFIFNAWGQLRMGSGRFEEAERELRNALAASDPSWEATTFRLNLAEALLAQGRTLEAAEEAREAEREAIRSGTVRKLPEAYRILGRIAAAEDNPDAFVLFERALEVIRQSRLPSLEEALTLQAYAESESRKGEAGTAAELLEEAKKRFRALGIKELRHPWMEYFGPKLEKLEKRVLPEREPTEIKHESDTK